jgi:hypothetical protein
MLAALAALGGGTVLGSCGKGQTVTSAEVRAMAKAMTGSDFPQKDADELYSHLHDVRFVSSSFKRGEIDPTIQPAVMFDPEVDIG